MIPLLINVKVTGKGAKKAKLSVNAEDALTRGKGFEDNWQSVSLSLLSATRTRFALMSANPEDLGEK